MATKYLEFDSSYRDRNAYPDPASFVIEISQTGQRGRLNAFDPVSNAAPILSWNNSFTENGAGSNIITGLTVTVPANPVPVTGGSTTAGEVVKVTADGADQLRQVKNFYSGAPLAVTTGGVTYSRRIVDYEPLNLTTALVTLESGFPDSITGTAAVVGAFFIANPTPLPTNTASPAIIKFFIPSGTFIDNFYNNYYIQRLNSAVLAAADFGTARLITAYDGTTHLATLESDTSSDGDWLLAANADTDFVIRKQLPLSAPTPLASHTIPALVGSGASAVNAAGNVIQLNPASAFLNSPYQGAFIRMLLPTPVAPFSTTTAPYGEQRLIGNYYAEDGTFVSAVGTSFTFGSSASTQDNFYVGMFITTNTAIAPSANTYIVTSYVGATRSGTVNVAFTGGDTVWTIRMITLSSPFSTNPVATISDMYEIEGFNRDNSVPFSYNGSLVSVTQEVCYEVELLNLILPNIRLQSGRGGRPAFYPYMYVELQQISAASAGANKGLIYSNNPNAYKMMYRVPMDDTPAPLISTFIKVDGDGMTHTVKFKPTDSFRFSVYHAGGELFKTVQQDYYSPSEPNPLVQISACFSFKRLS